MTNVLVVIGSPKLEKSNSYATVTPLIKGMENAGATVEVIYTKKQKILSCTGCFSCWYDTLGECVLKDDMQTIYPKLKNADVLVFATPLHSVLPGGMQNFVNRMIPLIEPVIEFKEGRTRARYYDYVKIKKILAVIVGGWYELENLSLPVKLFEEFAKNCSIDFAGAILRPHAYFMRDEPSFMEDKPEERKAIITKLEEVGYKFIKEGILNKEDLEFISQPVFEEEEYRKTKTNMYLKQKNQLLRNR